MFPKPDAGYTEGEPKEARSEFLCTASGIVLWVSAILKISRTCDILYLVYAEQRKPWETVEGDEKIPFFASGNCDTCFCQSDDFVVASIGFLRIQSRNITGMDAGNRNMGNIAFWHS